MRAILVTKDPDYRAEITDVEETGLPEGDVLVDVEFSTLNYKDSLALTGASPVVRSFPMVPGVDLAGVVAMSTDLGTAVGSAVMVNGHGLGEIHWGGYAERARLPADWAIPIPEGLDARSAMAVGTAGYTAMLCVMALESHGVVPDAGEIVVTGAAGGVGSMAIAILSRLGYDVVASTGRTSERDYLLGLGAHEVIDRGEFSEPGRPLGKERWAGAIDTVGSHTLANVCATTRYGGTVAACGLAQGMDLPATVAPFILRGVTLAGIDSVYCPRPLRVTAWRRISDLLDAERLEPMTTSIGLAEVFDAAEEQLEGRIRGRVVIDLSR